MSHPRSPVSSKSAELLKQLRRTWMTEDEITRSLGWSKNTVHVYLLDWVEEGLIEKRQRAVADGHQGIAPAEYSVSMAWVGADA